MMVARRDEGDVGKTQAAPLAHTVGEALDALSAGELEARIVLLHGEIERLAQAKAARIATAAAAAQFFKSAS